MSNKKEQEIETTWYENPVLKNLTINHIKATSPSSPVSNQKFKTILTRFRLNWVRVEIFGIEKG